MNRVDSGFRLLDTAWQPPGQGLIDSATDAAPMRQAARMPEPGASAATQGLAPAPAPAPAPAQTPPHHAGTRVVARALLVQSTVRASALFDSGLLASARCEDRIYQIDTVVATSLDVLEHLCGSLAPRVLVIDIALLDHIGADALRHHRRRLPATDWLLAWDTPTSNRCALAIRCRAHGCVEWAQGGRQLALALDAVLAGELWFAPTVLQSLYLALLEQGSQASAPADVEPAECALTSRESEVLACMRHGMTNKQIAGRLEISVNTVKKHLAHVYEKHGLHNGRQVFA